MYEFDLRFEHVYSIFFIFLIFQLCSTPGPPVFVQTAKETINVTKEMQSEKRRRVLNAAAVKRSRIRNREKEARKTQQNTEIYNTNTSLQTLIDKLYEFRNSKK